MKNNYIFVIILLEYGNYLDSYSFIKKIKKSELNYYIDVIKKSWRVEYDGLIQVFELSDKINLPIEVVEFRRNEQ